MTWQGHPIKYAAGCFWCTRVILEFLLPRLTDVLSTDTPMQLPQETLFFWNTESIMSKIDAAVVEFVPACQCNKQLFATQLTFIIVKLTLGQTHVQKTSGNPSNVVVIQTHCHWVHLLMSAIVRAINSN